MADWEAEFCEYFEARVLPLRRFAYALCGDWHLAEDLVQHTFTQLYRHWRRLDGATLEAYTRRVLVNAFLNSRRARRHEQVVADVPDRATPATDPGGDVLALLAQLPPRQRVLIALRYLDDLSVGDTATAAGISEGAVKSQTSRGLSALRGLLTPRPVEE
ncbi:DNA-directed RNA polymerase sigma-70 factor [Catellatospora sp. TT07R-123]|uniref:RNA polymerase sigma factor n=1 Tax=Catellatospora sp. TT07R-123 TaxID=2733863 RepID=UPI001B1D1FCE|nr:SigE family RNA polymerase sigma factor [Catellatospora sp. TT07R-123]GHJ45462.1 DNA-directed RNA polymerase sigma-70 factor [Catellatospora sp. TT07R-123]